MSSKRPSKVKDRPKKHYEAGLHILIGKTPVKNEREGLGPRMREMQKGDMIDWEDRDQDTLYQRALTYASRYKAKGHGRWKVHRNEDPYSITIHRLE